MQFKMKEGMRFKKTIFSLSSCAWLFIDIRFSFGNSRCCKAFHFSCLDTLFTIAKDTFLGVLFAVKNERVDELYQELFQHQLSLTAIPR